MTYGSPIRATDLTPEERGEDLRSMHRGKPPANWLAEQETRRRIGSVMLNMDMWDRFRKQAERNDITWAQRWQADANAQWHFTEMEKQAEWFFPEPVEQRQSTFELAAE